MCHYAIFYPLLINQTQQNQQNSMLINLSNHPSTKWSDKQKNIALEKYGEVLDLSFPAIAPDATIEKVLEMAEEFSNECRKIFEQTGEEPNADSNAVHIMGEMTFTHNLVRYLSHNGINAIASTTVREVTEKADGEKISVFRFVQFRPYRSKWEIPY
jgi:hypothetical protein